MTSSLSVIVLFENHEQCLAGCLDSVIDNHLATEIILVNGGSTDGSTAIARSYEAKYPNVTLTKQPYRGVAAARNHGVGKAHGEYVIFVSGDDKIGGVSLGKLYCIGSAAQADMVCGLIIDQRTSRVIDSCPTHLYDQVMPGIEGFTALVKANAYTPLPYGYMYRKEWLEQCNLSFDEESINADEFWMQSAFLFANKVLFTSIAFYYLAPKPLLIHDIDLDGPPHAKDLLRTGALLFDLAKSYSFEESQRIYNSCIYANALRVYMSGFRIVTALRTHSIFELPTHNMHSFKEIKNDISSEISSLCQMYYSRASDFEQEYQAWLNNPCDPIVSNMTEVELEQKRIILVYNGPAWQHYEDTLANLPPNYVITLDRKYKDRAFAIVFYMPGLNEHLYGDIEKPEGQIWIRWNMEPETKFLWMLNEELNDVFDLRMDYHSYADIVCPYYAGFKVSKIALNITPEQKKNKICMLISSRVNQSRREEYVAELMQYVDIDSYGWLYKNSSMEGEDKGWESKIALYGQYKFVIAFENSILEDYVTEKLYDPLLAGSVPIYMGAPNVHEFTPASDCLINTDYFTSPKELASYLKQCYEDDTEYMKYHRWREEPWNETFVKKVEIQDESPFIRLCQVLDGKDSDQ